MGRFLVLILLILTTRLTYAQTWTKTALNDKVTVNFPTPPDIHEIGNKKFYQVQSNDYIVNVLIVDMSVISNFLIGQGDIDTLYKGVINGMLDAATNSKLIEEREIVFNTYKGREIEYTKDFNGRSNIKVISRIVLMNSVLYGFEIWDLSGKGQKRLRKKFFKSIHIK